MLVTVKRLSVAIASFVQPAILAFRVGRIAGTTSKLEVASPIYAARLTSFRRTGGQQVSAVSDIFAGIPDTAILLIGSQIGAHGIGYIRALRA